MSSALNSIEAEYNEIVKGDGWHSLFQEIREKSDKEAKDKLFTLNESSKMENRPLNRYRDVNPYDHSRIILHRNKLDYINANLVKMERADRKYILTQGPLKETVGHFWLMVWEQKSKAILMLNKIIEKKQVKCHLYWPEKTGEEYSLTLPDVGLIVEYIKGEEYTNYCKRWFRVTDMESKQSREVIQFHYTNWPDFGIPSSPVAFLQFLKKVRDSGALNQDVGPAIVHCSAGIGRSGTFCLVDCCLVLMKKEGEHIISVRDILYELRRYRMGLIQTADQLYFSYQAIIEGMKLLTDPGFLDYDEVPTIPKEEDIPPPAPPKRVGSLGVAQNGGTYSINDKINDNGSSQQPPPIDRPLPPLPPVNESEDNKSDEDEDICEYNSEDENDEDSDDDNPKFNNLPPEPVEITEIITNEQDEKSKRFKLENEVESNDNIIGNGVSDKSSTNMEIRRRHHERQENIAKKVNEIKRKQREVEAETEASKKRRTNADDNTATSDEI